MATFTNITGNTLSLGVGTAVLAPDATVDETEQDITGLTNIKYFYDLEYLELTDGTPDFTRLSTSYYKGSINSTTYPAANSGDMYRVSAAGTIGSTVVGAGDIIICNTDDTAAGVDDSKWTLISAPALSFTDMATIDCSQNPAYPATVVPHRVTVEGHIAGRAVYPNDIIAPVANGEWVVLQNALTGLWADLLVPMTATKSGGSKDPGFEIFKTNGAGSQGVFLHWFDAASEEELYFSCQLPHCWNKTALRPHVHWIPKTTADGTPANQSVIWGLEYTWADIGAGFSNTSVVYTVFNYPEDANVVAGKHYLSAFASIPATATGMSSMLICRVFRDATHDNYEHDAGLLEIDFHYQTDKAGSRDELIY